MSIYRQSHDSSVFIITEISANHGQDYDRAVKMIRVAKECGANAVKFQAYTPETMTIDRDSDCFQVEHPHWGGQKLYDLYKKTYTPWEWFPQLKRAAEKEGIAFFATVFDKSSVDMLEKLHVPIHKISSFELVDIPLIEYVAHTGKPLLLSTGVATKAEIVSAVSAARKAGAGDITLLRCVSSYPADPEEMHLKTIPEMQREFGCNIGLSDHTLKSEISIAAVALGVKVIEKHFTLSRDEETPDSFFSIEPCELKDLVESIRTVEKALGSGEFSLSAGQKQMKKFERSLFAIRDIQKGETLTAENIRSIRPGYGLKPEYFSRIMGKKAATVINRGTPLRLEMIEHF